MAGIYIHIPFCKQACIYCNFHFSTSLSKAGLMAEAIAAEAAMRKSFIQEPVDTIYWGGGTPSLLDPNQLKKILDSIHSNYEISADAEISLEANPDDISPERLKDWMRMGINRLSIGIQSFDDRELKWMNRSHDGNKSLRCLQEIREAGFNNISADLIFGSLLSEEEILHQNIAHLIEHKVNHISAYGLTSEPRTRLHKMIHAGKIPRLQDEKQAREFLLISEKLVAAGYEHYEISNYAIPGFRSRHNSAYWNGSAYLGLGPSAHSFDGIRTRSWNVSDNAAYVSSIQSKELPTQREQLEEKDVFNEYMMLGLRKMEGIDPDLLSGRFGEALRQRFEEKSSQYISAGLMEISEGNFRLTDMGKLQADGIASSFFLTSLRPAPAQSGKNLASD